MPVEEQVVSIYAGTNGHLDDLAVNHIRSFEDALLEAFRTRYSSILESIKTSGKVEDEDSLRDAIVAVKAEYIALHGSDAHAPGLADVLDTDAEELGEAKSNKTLATE